ncbi:hydrolase 1, exosortase A system-associated [Novosphingobium album (ex Liu et al. 2023)]|uniref:Hydrolase 1, exosortase A system-associated n=1 Tax=Novosphingobium album (ex Liu et al. 2023) TaxID=3031130 RepID=A0ABT5WUJ7_9SPHN|nr:hydrolase 1, exosortase A system-associated [Novosphingobium album (ex Liu et al. 2023)]MDE8653546.1 hydrolase 1, exosortase A system-associated [Novosphingobium album (ex Liu et al. 2023)]
MSRRHLLFACDGARLVGTLDEGGETTGLLLVTGGNELRAGAWSGQAQFAAQIAAQGFPVFRFDRRGVGDSEGGNGEFRSSAPDIAAALATFRETCPKLARVIGLGNCDAASALMLAHGAGLDGLVLSNPWTIEGGGDEAPPEAVRDHYRRRLADPAAIRRLLTGQVSLGKLAASLIGALRPAAPPSSLAQDMAAGIAAFPGPIRFLIAGNDRTGRAFRSAWERGDPRIRVCEGASHSFVEAGAREWLLAQVLDALRG